MNECLSSAPLTMTCRCSDIGSLVGMPETPAGKKKGRSCSSAFTVKILALWLTERSPDAQFTSTGTIGLSNRFWEMWLDATCNSGCWSDLVSAWPLHAGETYVCALHCVSYWGTRGMGGERDNRPENKLLLVSVIQLSLLGCALLRLMTRFTTIIGVSFLSLACPLQTVADYQRWTVEPAV